MKAVNDPREVHIIFTDNNEQERSLFGQIVNRIHSPIRLTQVPGPRQLFKHLSTANPLPDFIILDYMLQLETGIECLKAIRSDPALCKIPVIIYANSAYGHQVNNAYENGADYYIQKPSDINETIKILTWLIAQNLTEHRPPSRDTFVLNARNLSDLTL